MNSLFGYALARMRFFGRNLLVVVIIALIIIPLEAVAVPLLFMVSGWGRIDTYHVQILPFVAQPLFIYLLYTFFLGLPKVLEEAARVDGGAYRVLRRLGLSIPHDVSVVGFDDQVDLATSLDPPLTTVALPHEAMGRWAVDRLLDQVDGVPGAEVPELRREPCPVVVRDSVDVPRHMPRGPR